MILLDIYLAGIFVFLILGLLGQPADTFKEALKKLLKEIFPFKENWASWIALILWPLYLAALIIGVIIVLIIFWPCISFKQDSIES